MSSTADALRTVIEDLRAERKRHEQEISEIDITVRRLEAQLAQMAKKDVVSGGLLDFIDDSRKDAKAPFAGMSNPDAAKAYLWSVGEPQETAEVRDALATGGVDSSAKSFHSSIYTALRRLADKGEVVQLDDGRWTIPERIDSTAEATES